MSEIVKVKKHGLGFRPATEEDSNKIENLLNEIYKVWEEDCISIYVGPISNRGGLEFIIDTEKDVPEKVNNILDKYQPKLIHES